MSLVPVKILEYENGRVIIGLHSRLIKETNDIILKFGEDGCEPYLAYVYLMTAYDSPFANLDNETERAEAVIFEVHATVGEIDPTEELLQPAVDKVKQLLETPMSGLAEELENELHRIRKYLKYTPLADGEGGNFKDRMGLMKEIEKISSSFAKVKKQAEEEIKTKLRGSAELGDY